MHICGPVTLSLQMSASWQVVHFAFEAHPFDRRAHLHPAAFATRPEAAVSGPLLLTGSFDLASANSIVAAGTSPAAIPQSREPPSISFRCHASSVALDLRIPLTVTPLKLADLSVHVSLTYLTYPTYNFHRRPPPSDLHTR